MDSVFLKELITLFLHFLILLAVDFLLGLEALGQDGGLGVEGLVDCEHLLILPGQLLITPGQGSNEQILVPNYFSMGLRLLLQVAQLLLVDVLCFLHLLYVLITLTQRIL